MKKILFSLSAVLLFNESLAFVDIEMDHVNFEAIEFTKSEGIVQGYDDGSYRPEQKINRAEFVKIIIESNYTDSEIKACIDTDFPDVKSGEWFHPYVCLAKKKGLIGGYPDGTFRPADNISFVEAAKIISNSFGFTAGQDEIWYKPFVLNLSDKFAIPDSVVSFDYKITRGEMAEMIWRLKNNIKDKPYKSYSDLSGENKLNPLCNIQQDPEDNCTAVNLGAAFDKKTNKCKGVSWGCDKPPFESVSECQYVCEKSVQSILIGCTKYYDGCNTCSVNVDGTLGACTEKYCFQHEEPYCMEKKVEELGSRDYCETDSDCAVKNVGNCCGYYPACVNKFFVPDLEAVQKECQES